MKQKNNLIRYITAGVLSASLFFTFTAISPGSFSDEAYAENANQPGNVTSEKSVSSISRDEDSSDQNQDGEKGGDSERSVKELAESALSDESVQPYSYYEYREKHDVSFGLTEWDRETEKLKDMHEDGVEKECSLAEKKYSDEIRNQETEEKKEKKKRLAELKKQKELLEKDVDSNDEIDEHQKAYTKKQYSEILRQAESGKWKKLGKRRWTSFCPVCNTPKNSYASASGIKLFEGCVASKDLPLGTIIKMNGRIYMVTGRCGTDAIDVFHDTPRKCRCSSTGSGHAEVYVLLHAGQSLPRSTGTVSENSKSSSFSSGGSTGTKASSGRNSSSEKKDRKKVTDKKKNKTKDEKEKKDKLSKGKKEQQGTSENESRKDQPAVTDPQNSGETKDPGTQSGEEEQQ